MRILAGKTNAALAGSICAILSIPFCARAQDAAQQAPAASLPQATGTALPDAAAAGQPAGGGGSAGPALDYLFNHKAQEGTVAKQALQQQGHVADHAQAAEALGLGRVQDPNVRERFESYLGVPEVSSSELQAYSAQVQKVLGLLKQNNMFVAWKELRALGMYDKIDAGVSFELANRIEAIWGADRATTNIQSDNAQLKKDAHNSALNADLRAEALREHKWITGQQPQMHNLKDAPIPPQGADPAWAGQANALPNAAAPGVGNASPPSMAGMEGKLQITEDYLHAVEAKAKIKLNELKMQRLFDTAKSDFTSYIGTLYGSGRHQHVVLASEFYRRMFNESEYPVGVGNQVNASLEVARSTKNTVDVFTYKLGRDDLAGATDRLQEAFLASEFNPAVLGIPRAQKERIADFLSRLSRLQSLLEAHDFGPLETLLNETKSVAKDFDPTKPLAIVNAVKLESKLRMGKAKLAAQHGDLKVAMDEFQAAAEAWPANPALQDSAGSFFDSQDAKSQSLVEFDRLLAEQNYRAIFDKQLSFAPAIYGDPKREEALKGALEKIKNAEVAYQKADLMRNAGDVFGAWEVIEQASGNLPSDNKLNMMRAELSGKGAEFVAAVNKAKDAEARKELGYSLSCFAVAQHYYPASAIANAGIQRISQQILSNPQAF